MANVSQQIKFLYCMAKHRVKGVFGMADNIVTVEVAIYKDGKEWDQTSRRHHTPEGGEEFMVGLVQKVLSSDLEDGPKGPYQVVGRVNGNEVANLKDLTIDDIRDLEDDLVEAYKELRGLSKQPENPERAKARKERNGKPRKVNKRKRHARD